MKGNPMEKHNDPESGSRRFNRLIHEKSPYLIQHADNPVDWYPWGEEALDKARREDKPIFLSIGYASCHWCHVMEEESFEDPAIAEILNRHFVAIKVDREERPDLDHLYMQAVMEMTGQGGWPLSVFLTPNGEPFYGGTYFPPTDRWGQPGFASVLRGIAQAWTTRRKEILNVAQSLADALRQEAAISHAGAPFNEAILMQTFQMLSNLYDEEYGGFSQAPKFPQPTLLSLLLRIWKRFGDPSALKMVKKTLDAMASGGIFDHLGGGFHRYSTDARWILPHFEKMLYDQALLATVYLEAYQATGKEAYAKVASKTLDYVLREMTDPSGGFYSSSDADSWDPKTERKREGAYYVWSQQEIHDALGHELSDMADFLFGIEPKGNVVGDPLGEFQGKNVLYRAHSFEEAARRFGKDRSEIETLFSTICARLEQVRLTRVPPQRDDKILTDWNGLMISALAYGAVVLGDLRYAHAAERAADFLLQTMRRPDGRLLHRYRDKEAGILANLDDYAFLVKGLLDLYQATFKVKYLLHSKQLAEQMLDLFWDSSAGGFFFTGRDADSLLVRRKEIYDHAVPSGNSVAAESLLKLGRLLMHRPFEEKAMQLFESFAGLVRRHPNGYPQLLIALDFALGPSYEIVLAAWADSFPSDWLKEIHRRFLPNKVLAFHPIGSQAEMVEGLIPFLKETVALDGKPTAYLCHHHTCEKPVTDLAQWKEMLDGVSQSLHP
jgi:hypothetical protein